MQPSTQPGKRFTAVSALAVVIGLVGSSCSSDAEEAEDSVPATTEATDPVTPTEPAPTQAEAGADTEPITLLVDSWNVATMPMWPMFVEQSDGVDVSFIPTESTTFDVDLTSRLESGSAGDIIGCRPHDRSRTLYNAGYLSDLSDFDTPRLDDFAYTAWTADDGARYCIPVSSVAYGFLYNESIFETLDLQPPTTVEEFGTVLETIESDGRYVPFALGSSEPSRIGNFLQSNLGPAFWGGDEGRVAIADGTVPVAESGLPELYELMASWGQYLPDGHELVDRTSSSDLFVSGDAAIVPVGSWIIQQFTDVDFEIGSFPAPGKTAADSCVVVSPLDFAFGMNPATEHPDEVVDFLEFVASEEFGVAFAENVTGQYSLQRPIPVSVEPLNAHPAAWIEACEPALNIADTGYGDSARIVLEQTWSIAQGLVQGTMTPDEATIVMQSAVDDATS